MMARIKQDPKNIYIEIEGHTDNVGARQYQRAHRARARRIRQELSLRADQIPLHKINVISYGKEKPVAPNKTGRTRPEPPRRHQSARVTSSPSPGRQLSSQSSVFSRLRHQLKTSDWRLSRLRGVVNPQSAVACAPSPRSLVIRLVQDPH